MSSWEEPDGREQVIAALTAAYIQGRLTKEEFDVRVGQALATSRRPRRLATSPA
jgi:uncharacterized protein DUF1707